MSDLQTPPENVEKPKIIAYDLEGPVKLLRLFLADVLEYEVGRPGVVVGSSHVLTTRLTRGLGVLSVRFAYFYAIDRDWFNTRVAQFYRDVAALD